MKKAVLSYLFAASSLAAAPQAIVFDFGGVLTGEANRQAVVDFIRDTLQLSKEEYESAYQGKKLYLKEGGSDERYWLFYAKKKGIALPTNWSDAFQGVLIEAIGVNPKMYDLVEELKEKKITVGLLSNIDDRLAKMVRDFGLYRPFEPCLLSCEIGFEKPDSRAYLHLLEKLNLPAKDVVFIDDKPENVEAAKKVGFDAILFQSEEQIRKELEVR